MFVNSRHPGPRRMWEVGSEPQFLTPLRSFPSLPSLRSLRSRVPKTQILSLYAWVRRSRVSGIGHGIKKFCACVGVCEGHDAPVQAPARPAQLSMVKHICFGSLFFQDWLRGLQLMRQRGGSCTMGHAQKWCFGGCQREPQVSPNGAKCIPQEATGSQRAPQREPKGRPKGAQGLPFRPNFQILYIQTPDQPPLAAVML